MSALQILVVHIPSSLLMDSSSMHESGSTLVAAAELTIALAAQTRASDTLHAACMSVL